MYATCLIYIHNFYIIGFVAVFFFFFFFFFFCHYAFEKTIAGSVGIGRAGIMNTAVCGALKGRPLCKQVQFQGIVWELCLHIADMVNM